MLLWGHYDHAAMGDIMIVDQGYLVTLKHVFKGGSRSKGYILGPLKCSFLN